MRISDWSSDVCSSDLLVARREQQAEGQRDGAEGPRSHGDVGGREGKAELARQALREKGAGVGLVRLVGVPALALQIGLAMQRLHQTRQREFLRIAEGEVADAGLDRKSTRLNSSH